MPRNAGDTEKRPWRTVVALVLLVAAGAAAWWFSSRGGEGRASVPAVCMQCGAEQATQVGDAPGQEEWPRKCVKCGAKHLYMARKCEKCGKPIAFKDPQAEKFGFADKCPFCKRSAIGS